MKKVSLLIFLIVICYLGYGQTYPVQQNLGAATTLVKTPNYGGLQSGLIPYTFSDTSAANTALTYLKNYNGALIYTTGDSSLWYRSSNASRWTPVLQSGGTSGIRAWLDGGNQNVLADGATNATFGTLGLNGISFKTNATSRFILGSTGIRPDTGTTSPIGVGADGYLHYTSGGGGGGGWNLIGNAGTTSSNFLGTTDAQPLVFKTAGVLSGKLDPILQNVSFGDESLLNNSSGSHNVGIGYQSLYNNTTAGNNTALGLSTLRATTTGTNNTAFGSNSLGQNTTGQTNIGFGNYSGFYTTNLSSRLYINSLDRGDISGDTTKSIIYGAQDATAANQRLYLNSQVYLPYAASGVGTKALRINPGTGIITYADTTAGGGGSGTVTNVSSANADITVATGTTTPVITMVQAPALRSATTTVNVSSATAPTTGQVLTATSGTAATWQTPSGGISGLTTNYITKAASSTSIGNSIIYDDGTNIGIGTTSPTAKMQIVDNNANGIFLQMVNNGASGASPNFIMGQAGSTAFGITSWVNSAVFEGQSIGGLAFGAYAGDIKFYANTSRTEDFVIKNGTGNVGIGTTSPAASAKLDITSTTQGVLFPRMTTTQKNAISSPAEGLVVYDLTLHKLCVYTGSAWEIITSL